MGWTKTKLTLHRLLNKCTQWYTFEIYEWNGVFVLDFLEELITRRSFLKIVQYTFPLICDKLSHFTSGQCLKYHKKRHVADLSQFFVVGEKERIGIYVNIYFHRNLSWKLLIDIFFVKNFPAVQNFYCIYIINQECREREKENIKIIFLIYL